MPEQLLVSIIIPTYNRVHLIGETLDSVLAQTYTNWECIVVDDGSADGTDVLMEKYIERDSRFQYHKRPDNHLSGGNGARNYGLNVSNGDFIQWFDSDDLMVPDFLFRKVEVIEQEKVDFVVSESLNFNKDGMYEIRKYKDNQLYELSGKNFILKKVYWMTPDFFIKRKCLKSFSFNETLKSGQETNFFIVFLSKTNFKGKAISEHLSLRRIHSTSIQQKLKQTQIAAYQGKLMSSLNAYNCIYKDIDNETKHFIQREIMTTFYIIRRKGFETKEFFKFTRNLIFQKSFFKASVFFISMLLNSYFNVGYKLFEYSRS